jgi:hypothetical protein
MKTTIQQVTVQVTSDVSIRPNIGERMAGAYIGNMDLLLWFGGVDDRANQLATIDAFISGLAKFRDEVAAKAEAKA